MPTLTTQRRYSSSRRGAVLALSIVATSVAVAACCRRAPQAAGSNRRQPQTRCECDGRVGDGGHPASSSVAGDCQCGSHDKGKRCFGASDCEILCSFVGFEPLTDSPDASRERAFGECAEFYPSVGSCYEYLPDDAGKGPRDVRFWSMCAD